MFVRLDRLPRDLELLGHFRNTGSFGDSNENIPLPIGELCDLAVQRKSPSVNDARPSNCGDKTAAPDAIRVN